MTLDPRCCCAAAAAPTASVVAAASAAAARAGLSLALDLAKLTLLLLLLSLFRFCCRGGSSPLQVLHLIILIGCPQQIILQSIEHIIKIEQLGGIQEILHILRLCCTTFTMYAGALCQLIGSGILARGRNYISTITDLQKRKSAREREGEKEWICQHAQLVDQLDN